MKENKKEDSAITKVSSMWLMIGRILLAPFFLIGNIVVRLLLAIITEIGSSCVDTITFICDTNKDKRHTKAAHAASRKK